MVLGGGCDQNPGQDPRERPLDAQAAEDDWKETGLG